MAKWIMVVIKVLQDVLQVQARLRQSFTSSCQEDVKWNQFGSFTCLKKKAHKANGVILKLAKQSIVEANR